ncbi:MAG: hypothetical protein ACI8VT_003111 [Saprospiraceae bacterium]|jgi:hypothetical protein
MCLPEPRPEFIEGERSEFVLLSIGAGLIQCIKCVSHRESKETKKKSPTFGG